MAPCGTISGAGAEACTGRPQKAAVVRGLLFEWFSVLRKGGAARIPLKLVMVKAAQFV